MLGAQKFVLFWVVACLSTLLSSHAVQAASFSCDGKLTSVERAICSNLQLSTLDVEMKKEYDKVRRTTADVVLSQRDWLKFGRNQCVDEACLFTTYERRIASLKSGNFRNWGALNMPEMAAAAGATSGVNYQMTNAAYQQTAKWMRESKFLERALAVAQTKYRYPANLKLVAGTCGKVNAFYVAESETVAICYELIERFISQYNKNAGDTQTTEAQRLAHLRYAVYFIILHELGHAALHNTRERPGMGNTEGEADNFASVNMIAVARQESEINEMLFGVHLALYTFFEDPNSVTALTALHDLAQRRYFNFACLVIGADQRFVAPFVKAGQYTVEQARRCQFEWKARKKAVDNLLALQVR